MVFSQIIAGFHALINAIGLPGNLLVILTVAFERRFHFMRYILLASLAVSDMLFLILVNSFRIASIAQERWLYGQTMCNLNVLFLRYFYFNTVLHLIAVSYERYKAIVKSPLTYDGTITKTRMLVVALIWVLPIPVSIGPFNGWDKIVYSPEVFFCEHGWSMEENSRSAHLTAFSSVVFFVIPFLLLVYLNWSVFKTANMLQRNTVGPERGTFDDSNLENQLQEMARRRRERKAAVDVAIIIAAFVLCYLPKWITGLCRQFGANEIPAEAILATNYIFFVSSLCNPMIYSIRKREFRAGVKNFLRRIGINCGRFNDNNELVFRGSARVSYASSVGEGETTNPRQDGRSYGSTERTEVTFQERCLSPIQEISE